MTAPTAAQLAAAGLVELPGEFPHNFEAVGVAVGNGWVVRTFNGAKFPPISLLTPMGEVLYSSEHWATKKNASGIFPVGPKDPTLVLAYLDEFETGQDASIWTANYSGHSEGVQQGQFGGDSHVVCPGDSTVRLLAFPDPELSGGLYNDWVGAGFGAWNKPLPVGSEVYTCAKVMLHENVACLPGFLIGSGEWPPEIDAVEITPTLATPKPTSFAGTIHWSASLQQQQIGTDAAFPFGLDFTEWHVYGCQWGAATITLTIDGHVWATFANPSQPGDVHGLAGPTPMVVSIQTQTGDPGTPQPDAAVTASAPVEMVIDWCEAFMPSTAAA